MRDQGSKSLEEEQARLSAAVAGAGTYLADDILTLVKSLLLDLLNREVSLDGDARLARIAALSDGADSSWANFSQALRHIYTEIRTNQPANPPTCPSGQSLPLPPLSVMTLGHIAIKRGNEVIPPCRSRKAIAILRYLLTRRHYLAPSTELAELLWPGVEPQRAIHNVHVTVNLLRRHIDPSNTASYLIYQGGAYSLSPYAGIESDGMRFERVLAEADREKLSGRLEPAADMYRRALELYEGDYYVDEHDTAWALAERERLLLLYLHALQQCGDTDAALGHVESAIEYYQRLLSRDGYREDIHARVMRCYLEIGRRIDALRQYRQCQEMLATDLGLEPSPELQILHRATLEPGLKHESSPS